MLHRDALVLSPMVDVTDAAFRSLAREGGADVTCSEMAAARGLLEGHASAWRTVTPWPGERPYGIQFMTGDGKEAAAAVRAVGRRLPIDFVDLNLGCPAPSILRSCAGGFLLKDPGHAGRVVRAARAAADEVGIAHVSVKMRTGMDTDHLTFLDVADEAVAAGASWITLHGRTVAQGYRGNADWNAIARLAAHVDIPVVGNGDLRMPEDVLRMRAQTGCHGFFIARAAMRDPTVFARMRAALDGRPVPPEPGLQQRMLLAQAYVRRAQRVGQAHPAALARQVARFASGAPGARALRMRLHACRTVQEVEAVVAQAVCPTTKGAARSVAGTTT